MKKSLFILLLVGCIGAALLLIVNQNNEENPVDKTDEKEKMMKKKQEFNPGEHDSPKDVSLSFKVTDDGQVENQHKKIIYTIKNTGKQTLNLEFGTSQKYEYVITDKNGNEVYRYSKHNAFMQVLQELKLGPGEEKQFDIILPELEKGRYTFEIFLVAKGFSHEKKMLEFTVE